MSCYVAVNAQPFFGLTGETKEVCFCCLQAIIFASVYLFTKEQRKWFTKRATWSHLLKPSSGLNVCCKGDNQRSNLVTMAVTSLKKYEASSVLVCFLPFLCCQAFFHWNQKKPKRTSSTVRLTTSLTFVEVWAAGESRVVTEKGEDE